ncbi:MAG: hypothetical protein Q4G50_06390 [Corynebacterium sp.]|uniref:hypothetical protein n=1 Tax=Corynebacterium sp. TaxID=1720 RepID=UPI0026E108F0|nr:hypothetical protein [Corynebacterium sp.]MDO5669615.1 hypothetical protein [Corynebacterium sp.]
MSAIRSATARRFAWAAIVLNFVLTYVRWFLSGQIDRATVWEINNVTGPLLTVVLSGFALLVAILNRRLWLGLAALASFAAFFVIIAVLSGACEVWVFFFWERPPASEGGSIPPFWACQVLDP